MGPRSQVSGTRGFTRYQELAASQGLRFGFTVAQASAEPLGLAASARRPGRPSRLRLAARRACSCQTARVNIWVSVSIIKGFFPPSRIYDPTVKLPSRLQAGRRGVFISDGQRGLQDLGVDAPGSSRHLAGLPRASHWRGKPRAALPSCGRRLLQVTSIRCRDLQLLGQGTEKPQQRLLGEHLRSPWCQGLDPTRLVLSRGRKTTLKGSTSQAAQQSRRRGSRSRVTPPQSHVSAPF